MATTDQPLQLELGVWNYYGYCWYFQILRQIFFTGQHIYTWKWCETLWLCL